MEQELWKEQWRSTHYQQGSEMLQSGQEAEGEMKMKS